MKLRLVPRAVRDLAEIEAYVSADDSRAATAVASRLIKTFDLIAAQPEIGRPAAREGIREWSVPGLPDVIAYRVEGGCVEILRVWHTRRKRPERW